MRSFPVSRSTGLRPDSLCKGGSLAQRPAATKRQIIPQRRVRARGLVTHGIRAEIHHRTGSIRADIQNRPSVDAPAPTNSCGLRRSVRPRVLALPCIRHNLQYCVYRPHSPVASPTQCCDWTGMSGTLSGTTVPENVCNRLTPSAPDLHTASGSSGT